ncbi:hypothetical protein TIFTF001_038792 [Ficus carica]|uniref:Uncharacterized protein n=1 Tax=Ficus carica TaxID=3494 RepID=A0AA88EB55_FICCA|nr:hypothetical protein TIFTF001_038792 [Ficus carica]
MCAYNISIDPDIDLITLLPYHRSSRRRPTSWCGDHFRRAFPFDSTHYDRHGPDSVTLNFFNVTLNPTLSNSSTIVVFANWGHSVFLNRESYVDIGVTQPFLPKVATDVKGVINFFKYHPLPDSGIHPKRYPFGPLLRGISYESVGAPNGRAQTLLRDPSQIGCLPNSSMLLHHSPVLRKMPPPRRIHGELQKVKHFMPSSLLRSQLDLLHNDELEDAMVKSGSSYRRNYTSIDKIDYSI